MVESKQDFFSIGQLAAHLQASVRQIEAAAERAGLQPALRLNMVPHWNGDQVEILRAQLNKGAAR